MCHFSYSEIKAKFVWSATNIVGHDSIIIIPSDDPGVITTTVYAVMTFSSALRLNAVNESLCRALTVNYTRQPENSTSDTFEFQQNTLHNNGKP